MRTHRWGTSIEVDNAIVNHRLHRVHIALLGGIPQRALEIWGRDDILALHVDGWVGVRR